MPDLSTYLAFICVLLAYQLGGVGPECCLWSAEALPRAGAPPLQLRSLCCCRFRFKGGPVITNDTIFQDIVPDQRIVIAYHMTVGGNPISVSLATMQFEPDGSGTRLVFTEQDAFLDGYDDVGQREEGTRELLEAMARQLEG